MPPLDAVVHKNEIQISHHTIHFGSLGSSLSRLSTAISKHRKIRRVDIESKYKSNLTKKYWKELSD